MWLRALFLVAVTTLLGSGSGAGDETLFKVVVHPSNPTSTLSTSQLSRIFLKKTTTWENGTLITPVDQVERSAVRAAFSQTVFEKSSGAIESYWQQQLFAGREVPPLKKASDGEVLAFVRTHPGAVGYVSASAATDGVKVLRLGR